MTLAKSKIVCVGCLSWVGVWMSQSKRASRRSLKPKVDVHFSNLSPKAHSHLASTLRTCDQILSDWFEGTPYLDLCFSRSNKLRGIIWVTTGMMVASSVTDQQIMYQIKLENNSWTDEFCCSPPPGRPRYSRRFRHGCSSSSVKPCQCLFTFFSHVCLLSCPPCLSSPRSSPVSSLSWWPSHVSPVYKCVPEHLLVCLDLLILPSCDQFFLSWSVGCV